MGRKQRIHFKTDDGRGKHKKQDRQKRKDQVCTDAWSDSTCD